MKRRILPRVLRPTRRRSRGNRVPPAARRLALELLEDRSLLSSIAGTVWRDSNGNGAHDEGEPGLEGWVVYLDADDNGSLDPGERTSASGPDGQFAFSDLPAGDYVVREVLQPGFRLTAPPSPDGGYTISLGPGETRSGCDFLNLMLGSISGQVYADLDGDGSNVPALLRLGGETLVNTYTKDWQGSHAIGPSMASDTHGNFVVVWESWGQDGDARGVFARRFDANGAPLDAQEFQVNAYSPGEARKPAIAMNASGEFVIVWEYLHYPVSGWNIFAKRYNTAGEPQGDEFQVGYRAWAAPFETLDSAGVAMDDQGDFVVAWSGPGNATAVLYSRRFDAQTRMLGPVLQVNDAVDAEAWVNSVAMNGAGDFVITWHTGGISVPPVDAWAELYDADGNVIRSDFKVNSYTNQSQGWSSAAMDPGGNFVVTWSSLGQGGPGYEVYAQRFDSTGLPLGGEIHVNTIDLGDQYLSRVAIADDGRFIIAWQNQPTKIDDTWNVYAQRFEPDGTRLGSEFRVKTTVGHHTQPSVATGVNGQFTVSWFGLVPAEWDGVFFQRFRMTDAEQGLAGWTVYLDEDGNGELDPGEQSTLTDPLGRYAFVGLAEGTYLVREVLAQDWSLISPPAGYYRVRVPAGGIVATDLDFGNLPGIPLGEISGRLFADANGNGLQDAGENGLFGWRVYLDANQNGTRDKGEISATTDEEGRYRFSGIVPETYILREEISAGWTPTGPATGSRNVTLESGAILAGQDFANGPPASIAGVVFADRDGDGSRDAGEDGVADWSVYLDANDNGALDVGERSVVTDANGHYEFPKLLPGTYVVRDALRPGWTPVAPSGSVHRLTVGYGDNVPDRDFANGPPISIGGMTFVDGNGDGVRDPEENGLSDCIVFLDANDNGWLDADEVAMTTDSTGEYVFRDLLPGTYTVRQIPRPDSIKISPIGGFYRVSVTGFGTESTGWDFANGLAGHIYGWVFNDINANGAQDGEEGPLAGREIFLDANDNRILDPGEPSAITDDGGAYAFAVPGGDYVLREVLQSGWRFTVPASGGYRFHLPFGGEWSEGAFGNHFGPIVSIGSLARAEGDSGTTPFTFAVTLDSAPTERLAIDYSTFDDTAAGDDGSGNGDYVPASGTLTFPPGGSLSQSFTVYVIGDTEQEPDKTFGVDVRTADGMLIATAWGKILDDDSQIQVALIPVLTPSPASLPGANLPAAATSVPAGSTYYVEMWVQDTGKPSAAKGVTGGSVDVYYDTNLADVRAIKHKDFSTTPTAIIDDEQGVVDDVGGGTLSGNVGKSPKWARMGYLEVLATAAGDVVWWAAPGELSFSRYGLGSVDWQAVQLHDSAAVRQVGGAQVDVTLVREPSSINSDTGEVKVLPESQAWIHEWEPYWAEVWLTRTDGSAGLKGGTVDLSYDTRYATATQIEYGPAFTANRAGTIDDAAGMVRNLGANTARTDVGDGQSALLARIRFEPIAADQAMVDEVGHGVGPYPLNVRIDAVRVRSFGSDVLGAVVGQIPATVQYAVPYDIDDNNQIDFGDFSYFAAAFNHEFGSDEPPYTWWADFERGRGFGVDFGDLSIFAPNFGLQRPSTEVTLPPNFPAGWVWLPFSPQRASAARLAANALVDVAAAPRIHIVPVAVADPSSSDSADTLPASLAQAEVGSSVYVELWVQDEASEGLIGGLVDVGYPTSRLDGVALDHGDVFTTFAGGTIRQSDGLVDDFGGGTLEQGVAVAPQWTRLGFMEFTVTSQGTLTFGLAPGKLPFSRFGAGNVAWSDVDMDSLSLNFQAHFDFGTKKSPVAPGYAGVNEKTIYSAKRGYGWTSGKIASADRGSKLTALDRDLNYTSRGIFVADVPNGTYRVTLRLGDPANTPRDQMGITLEGVLADVMDTSAKTVISQEYLVGVDDGQLTVALQDLGGKDKYVSITAMDVVSAARDDWEAPAVTIDPAPTQSDPATAAPILFSVVFSEPVAGFSAADVDLSQSTAAGHLAARVTGSGAEYQVAVSGMTGSGMVVAEIATGAARDLSGNESPDAAGSVTYYQPIRKFDFGTTGSKVEPGYTRISPKSTYTSKLGYGWTSGKIASADRGTGTALDRDLCLTSDGTFVVDVPDGQYYVEMRLGDLGSYVHDEMNIFLEGEEVDTVDTPKKTVVSWAYEVAVWDGQLTIQLTDLGGADKNAAITALTVSRIGESTASAATIVDPSAGGATPADGVRAISLLRSNPSLADLALGSLTGQIAKPASAAQDASTQDAYQGDPKDRPAARLDAIPLIFPAKSRSKPTGAASPIRNPADPSREPTRSPLQTRAIEAVLAEIAYPSVSFRQACMNPLGRMM